MRGAGWVLGLSVALTGAAAAQAGCFRTAAEAAAGVGVGDAAGFRLESVREDALGGGAWARVRSCARPELPAMLVRSGLVRDGGAGRAEGVTAVQAKAAAVMVLRAGTTVRALHEEAALRMEVPAVAMESGAKGQVVRLRVRGAEGERVVTGVVVDAATVELEGGW